MKLSRLEWSDYPPVEDMSGRITIRVCNQDGRGSKPTVEIKDLLVAEGYCWDKNRRLGTSFVPRMSFR